MSIRGRGAVTNLRSSGRLRAGVSRHRPTPGGQTRLGASLPGASLPGDALPGDALPGDALPGDALPGDALPGGVMPEVPCPFESPAAQCRADVVEWGRGELTA
jgi:hypothetical protein